MSVTYQNAPLVELIAELRWTMPGAQQSAPQAQPGILLALPQARTEELFMHLAALMSTEGYGRFERTFPPGLPIPANQVACRFRPSDPDSQSPLFQVGPTVFTANALPPYESWSKFSPLVKRGMTLLLQAFERSKSEIPSFDTALIRYIDAFRDDLTDGRSLSEFLREVMRLELVLPRAILTRATAPADIEPLIRLAIPTAIGRLELTFAEGKHGNDRAIIMDCSILMQRNMGNDVDRVLEAFSEGRLLIHELFRGLTEPIHEKMEPLE